MRFHDAPLQGLRVIEPEPHRDDRGLFARTWCREEFAAAGLPIEFVQSSVSVTAQRGTLRGLHFQRPPSHEGKLVRCTRGRIHDVLVDLRRGSPSYGRHHALELDDRSLRAVYVPPGVAHGFQTLCDDVEVLYQMTAPYAPALADGVRHDDPAFGIRWPLPVSAIHERDRSYPDFGPERAWGTAA
jgi:dTDP-4-dehydrorhamnose 3,5-epimerase